MKDREAPRAQLQPLDSLPCRYVDSMPYSHIFGTADSLQRTMMPFQTLAVIHPGHSHGSGCAHPLRH
jgi:hypothetical protein